MNSSRNDMILRLLESPRTAFSTKGVALLTDVERGALMTQRLNYYVRQGRLLNLRKGIYAKRDYFPEE